MSRSTITPQQQKQLDDLLKLTIIPALFEDFEWQDQDQLDDAVNYLNGKIVQGTDEKLVDDDTEQNY